MNDDPHSNEELDHGAAERVEGDQNRAWKETAFRRAVARRFYCEGQDTAQIAAELEVDEAAVYGFPDFSVDVTVFMLYSHGVLIRKNRVEGNTNARATLVSDQGRRPFVSGTL